MQNFVVDAIDVHEEGSTEFCTEKSILPEW